MSETKATSLDERFIGMNVKEVAIGTEERTVLIPFTDEELSKKKDEFFQDSLKLSEIQKKLDEIKKHYATEMNPLKVKIAVLLEQIHNKGYTDDRVCYLIDDQELGVMNYLLEDGTHVHMRKLTAGDMQLHINSGKVHPIEKK